MTDTALLAKKMQAARAKIGELADASGYGHFITDATREQWAALIVSAVDDAEADAQPAEGKVAGVEVHGEEEEPEAGG
jgi:hypothetical protein